MSISTAWRFAAVTLGSTIVTSLALSSAAFAQASARQRAPQPRLVVFLTVDQLRPDYLDRWAAQLGGGLGRLSKRGAFFTNAFQEHGITETAPGHSVTMSGRFPRSTGILSNAAGVEDPQAPLLTSRDPGASPFRFRGTALIDWMRARDPRTRALSISRKDRGAILPLGRAKQSVFWYATSNGEFTTSRYYADTLPTWIRRVNARRYAQRLAGQSWTLLLPEAEYLEPDGEPLESSGRNFTFPHLLSTDTVRAAGELPSTPWMDRFTLDAALEGLQAMNLGRGPQTDLLAVSLSATDYIGHRYGPDSRELHDNILRLDRSLATFIDSLYKLRDSATIVFALTADHGVTPFPELAAQRARRPAPPRYDLRAPVADLREALRAASINTDAVQFDGSVVIVDRAPFERMKVDPDPILARFADAVRRQPGIARVDRVRDLARRDTVNDVIARRWLHMLPPGIPAEYVVTPVRGAYPRGATSAQHGSPHDDDAHVPVIFYGAGIQPGRIADRVTVADMAPTLARLIGVTPSERLDGRVLRRALEQIGPR